MADENVSGFCVTNVKQILAVSIALTVLVCIVVFVFGQALCHPMWTQTQSWCVFGETRVEQKHGNSVRLLVVGDWGTCGEVLGIENRTIEPKKHEECDFQKHGSRSMAQLAETFKAEAVLGVGDSFYPEGLESDEMFTEVFSNIYNQDSLKDLPWWNVFGNHDYRNRNFRRYINSHKLDSRWNGLFEGNTVFPKNGKPPVLEVVFIDTTPFDEKYLSQNLHGLECCHFAPQLERQASPTDPPAWQAELKQKLSDFEGRLKDARDRGVKWLIVAGHNPIRSRGDHGDLPAMVALVDPLLWKYKVDAYFGGHDHHAEHTVMDRCCYFRKAPSVFRGHSVVINEALVVKPGGKWVELYNIEEATVDITGWKLVIASTGKDCKIDSQRQSLSPHEFLVIDFSKDKERNPQQCKMKENDLVTLVDARGTKMSELAWGFSEMMNGYSVGRYPDGSEHELVIMNPTRNSPNGREIDRNENSLKDAPASWNQSGWFPPDHEQLFENKPGSPGQQMHYFAVGNGGKLGSHRNPSHVRVDDSNPNATASWWYQLRDGFFTLEGNSHSLYCRFYDYKGVEVHSVTIQKEKKEEV